MRSVLITGPTGSLGREAVMSMATRPAPQRPDLILIGRSGARLSDIAERARSAGATVHEIACDMASLPNVRAAADAAKELLATGATGPLHGLVANAGLYSADTRKASADGYEVTFAVNYLAHALLIGDLLGSFTAPARIVLLGSNTYHANLVRTMLRVPPAHWRDLAELARPAAADTRPSLQAAGVAYSDSKLAVLYYAHELQRHAPAGISVAVFEPGFMPGTGLARDQGAAAQRAAALLARVPGISSPVTSGPMLASVVLDDRWAHLRDGAFVVKNAAREVKPLARDRAREARLWQATAELIGKAVPAP